MIIKLTDYDPAELAEVLELKPFQGRQLFQWIHRRRIFDFDQMTDLSKDLRARLARDCTAAQLTPVRVSESADSPGTRKALLALEDGETVEAVRLEDSGRITLCLSTQVGCGLRCAFCATGATGLARNLTPGEIVEQALTLLAGDDLEGRTPNIVYMGMGEPFRNYDATVKSIRLLMRKEGLGIGARKITVSSAGDVPGIRRFTAEDWQVRLSISLHAANDTLRTRLVPLNRRYPLADLMGAVRGYIDTTGRQVTFEWVLLKGVNDSRKCAEELAALVKGLDVFVNVIPFNPVSGLEFEQPSQETCRSFNDALLKLGVKATFRRERGGDIDAACGQLRRTTLGAGSA